MRSLRTVHLILLLTAFALSACKDSGDPVSGSKPSGGSPSFYSYRAYNTKGTRVVEGSMTLAFVDSTTINGAWQLQCIVQGEPVGPQTGKGTLSGSITGTVVNINLNPGWMDNNVFLSGSFGMDRLTGTWMWSTFVGSTSEGTFEALKTK